MGKKTTLTNAQIESYLIALNDMLDFKGLLGYAVAMNITRFEDVAIQYLMRKQEFLDEFGVSEVDDEGNSTGNVKVSLESDEAKEALNSLGDIAGITHEIEVVTVPASKVIEQLTAKEVLALRFMLEDEDADT